LVRNDYSKLILILYFQQGIFLLLFFIDSVVIFNAVKWEQKNNSRASSQLKGVRWFSFDEMRKYTNNLAEASAIGSGGYAQVFINFII